MAERMKPIERKIDVAERIEVRRVESKENLSSAEKLRSGERQKQTAEQARESVEKLARKSSETILENERLADEPEQEIVLNKSYKSVMHRVERQLPAYQRAFSKVIRNPSVDKASTVVSNTVARPSAVIGGAGLAFFGLLIFMISAKSVGFAVPNSLFVLLVIVGWVGGLLFDLFHGLIKRTKKHQA
jgi:Rad3-related DNA helicase